MIPKVGTGFLPARSFGNRLHFRLMLRRAKAGRKRSCQNKKARTGWRFDKSHHAL